jgi:apolipoprotein N-acyltransferase
MSNRQNSVWLLFFKAVINGLLFAVPFIWDQVFFLIFFAFVQLFLTLNKLEFAKHQLAYSFMLVVVWHSITMHWVHFNDFPWWVGLIAIFISCLVTFSALFIYCCCINRLAIKRDYKYFLFILAWIFIEWLSFEWELAFPFHVLGYYLGDAAPLIYWYQYTGVLGGSLWILLVNIAIIKLLDKKAAKISKWGYLLLAIVPLGVSAKLYFSPTNTNRSEKILVVATKKEENHKNTVFRDAFYRVSAAIDKDVFLVVCPESSCYLPASSFPHNFYFSTIKRTFKQQAPRAGIIFGATTQDIKGGPSFSNKGLFNMAIHCDTSGLVAFRNKTQLAPFGEFIPYEKFFGKIFDIKKIVPNPLIYKSEYDNIFTIHNIQILPLICYELYFSSYIAEYLRKGDIGLIAAISDDNCIYEPVFGQQLVRMSRTQAVSFHKSVVKSTNHGISLIISPKGEIMARSGFNTSEIIGAEVPINNKLTLYGKYGDAVICLLCLALLLPVKIMIRYEK